MADDFVVKARLLAEDQMSGVMGSASRAVSGLLGQLTTLAGLAGAGLGIGALVSEGIQFNQTLESTGIGIAAVLTTMRQYKDAVTGEVLTGQKAFNAAQVEATAIQEDLKNAALATKSNYVQMVEAFQLGLSPMQRAGIAQKDMVEAMQLLTQAAGAVGVPMAQLGIETRQFFEGDYQRSLLLRSLNITKEQMEELVKSGGVMDFMRDKLGGIAAAGAASANSFEGLASNLKDVFQQALGQGMVTTFDTMKGVLNDLIGLFGHMEKEGTKLKFVFNEELIGALKAFGITVAAVFKIASESIKNFMTFANKAVTDGGTTWTEVFQAFGLLVVKTFAIISKVFGVWGAGIVSYVKSPLDTIKGLFITFVSGVLALLSELLSTAKGIPGLGKAFGALSEQVNKLAVYLSNTDAAKEQVDALSGVYETVDKTQAEYEALIIGLDTSTGKAGENAGAMNALGSDIARAGEEVDDFNAKLQKNKEQFDSHVQAFREYRSMLVRSFGEMNEAIEEQQRLFNSNEDAFQQLTGGVKKNVTTLFTDIKILTTNLTNTMMGTLQNGFIAVLTGEFENLGDVLNGFFEGMAASFATYLAQMMADAIASADGIGKAFEDIGKQMQSSGLTAGLYGAGIGSIVGQAGGNRYNQIGGTIGGAAGGVLGGAVLGAQLGVWAGPIGAIVGAILGTVIGAIVSPHNTEQHIPITGSRILLRGGQPGGPVGRALVGQADSLVGQLGDLAEMAGQNRAATTGGASSRLLELLNSLNIDIHAGADEHLQADLKNFLEYSPTMMLKRLFGYLQQGAGGGNSSGVKPAPDIPGVSGMPGFSLGIVDRQAPIFQMLEDLGFAYEKIRQIGDQIDQRGADDFMEYLTALVDVVVTSNRLATEFAKSPAELMADLQDMQSRTVVDSFQESADQLIRLSEELSLYSGDEQIRRAQEINRLGEERHAAMMQFLAEEKALAESLAQSIAAQQADIRYSLMDEGGQRGFLQQEMQRLLGLIPGATSIQEVGALQQQIQEIVSKLFGTYGQADQEQRQAIGDELIAFLDQVNAAAQERLAAITEQVVQTNAGLSAIFEQNAALFTQASDAAGRLGGNATFAADELNGLSASAGMASDSLLDAAAAARQFAIWLKNAMGGPAMENTFSGTGGY